MLYMKIFHPINGHKLLIRKLPNRYCESKARQAVISSLVCDRYDRATIRCARPFEVTILTRRLG